MNLNDKRLLLLVIFTIILIKKASSVIIANSKLEICTNTSNTNNNNNINKNTNSTFSLDEQKANNQTSLKCKEKLVVSLAIDNSKSADTDYLEAFIYEVDSQREANQIQNNNNNNNNKKKLQNPIRINISKSPVYIEYPSIYFQTFNHKPTEQVIISDLFSCEDGDLAQSPTCGWTMNSLNQRIPYSQGFCCKCDFVQIIGINNTDRNRGNTCKLLNLGSGSATAHCLKYDPLWWNAYEVYGYQLVYEISIFVSYLNAAEVDKPSETGDYNYGYKRNSVNNKKIETENSRNLKRRYLIEDEADSSFSTPSTTKTSKTNSIYNSNSKNLITNKITLSPSTRVAASQDSKLIARLIGDFLPTSALSDFSNYYLLIPSYPSSHPMVTQGPLNWMLIPREHFTLDGRQCNKIGVAYSAFRAQESKCLMRIGECLNNQIADFIKSDLDRVSSGKAANYIVSQANFMNGAEPSFYSFSEQSKKLAFKLSGVFNSLITLEISADELKYVVNISQAKIDFVKIEMFENNSKNGIMQLQLTNIGKLSAEFSLGFNCSEFVLPLNGEQMSLEPFESKSLKKSVFTSNVDEDFKRFNFTLNHRCAVKASDFNGNQLDEKIVFFNTTKIQEVNIQLPENSTVSENVENSNGSEHSINNSEFVKLDCALLCPDFFGFLCFVVHGCWGFFVRTVCILLALLGFVIILIRAIKNGSLFRCLKKICFWFSAKDNNNNNSENKKVLSNNNDAFYADDFKSKNDKNDFYVTKRKEIKIIQSRMFLNFSNINFDFSQAGLFHNFSIQVIVFYCFTNNKLSIKELNFPNNFIAFCERFEIKDALDFSLLKNKIKFLPNFLTKMPLYSLFRWIGH